MKIIRYILVIVVCIFSVVSYAYDFKVNGIYYEIESKKDMTCGVVAGEIEGEYEGEIVLPEFVTYESQQYTVTSIKSGAFNKCKLLEKLTIPATITNIGTTYTTTFDECTSLKILIFKDGSKTLTLGYGKNGGTFYDSPLDSIYLGRNLYYKSAGNYSSHPPVYSPFAEVKTLRSVYISNMVEIIPHSLFYNCSGLKNVLGMEAVKTIESSDFSIWATSAGVFEKCTSLEYIILPDNVNYLGTYAFAGCTNLKDVYIGSGITTFEHSLYIFQGCNLHNLYLGSALESIGKYSFYTYNLSIQNLYIFSNKLNNISNKDFNSIPLNTKIFVTEPSQYSSLFYGYSLNPLVTFEENEFEYSGIIPYFNHKNNVRNTNVSFETDALNKNTGYFNGDVRVCFSFKSWNMVVELPIVYSITKAQLIITPKDFVVTYGDEIPNADCIYQGLKNNETPDYALSKLPSVTTSATQDSDAGEYKLYASGAEAKNYSISYQIGKLTIKPAEQSIDWKQNFENVVTDSKIELSATSSSGLDVQYSSSDPAIAYIVEEGNKTYLYTRKDGVVVITASQAGNKNYKTASSLSKTIIVTPRTATGISLSETNISLRVGEEFCLTATVSPESTINKGIDWKSLDDAIATVSNGVVRALKIGETTIQATTKDGSNLTASCQVVVSPVMISSIVLSPNIANIDVGENILLSAEIAPTDASNRHLQWSSSNTEIATVLDGVVTGIKPGQVTITAQSTDGSNKTAMATITVKDIKASDISIDKTSVSLFVGDEEELHATISPKDASNKEVFWSTSDATVATVTDGVVIATGSGTAIIKASTTDGTNLSATCQVIVNKKKQTISWQQSLDNIQHGGQLVELTAASSSGLRIKYKSSDDRVVSIFDLGEIVYLNPGNPGQTTVIAYQEGNNEYLSIEATKDVSVVNSKKEEGNVLIVYYSQSFVIDGIVAELANQIASSGVSTVTKKIEPTNARINDANKDESVRDSIMNVISQYPNMPDSYPSIAPIDVNVSEYDNVLMVYPIWNNKMAAPMQTFNFTNKTILKNKPIAYIEYDLFGESGSSADAKVLRLNASDINDKEDMIREWLNHTEETGILHINQAKSKTIKGIYDLQGRKLQKTPNEGLYIIKGHKIVIKNGRVN